MTPVGTDITAREAEVLALLRSHLTNVQIADALFISKRTVESHVSALMRKLQLRDRRSLARSAYAHGRGSTAPGHSPLPTPVTPFVGRVTERAALVGALAESRLVTATGPGGVGKTRLAVSVASEVERTRADGVSYVDLVHVSDPAMVVAAVAEAVRVAESQSGSIEAALVVALAERDMLLVLDNCEHLLDGVRSCIDRILAKCPGITVLATSRSRLLLPYEHVYRVPGLSVSEEGGDALVLFATRVACATGDSTPVDSSRVAALCRALEGMALAIELAAARYPSLGLDGLEAGLGERLQLLTAGGRVADRHRSLRDAIAWSYDLLPPDDAAALRGVTLFASWFDVDAARAVIVGNWERADVADALARLADHSLLVVEQGEPTRYRALEMIRQFGLERLVAAGELAAIRSRHLDWCRAMLVELRGAPADDAWCIRFDGIAGDVRAVLLWLADEDARRAEAADLAADLAALLFLRGRLMEAQRRFEQAAALEPGPSLRIDHLRAAAGVAASRFMGNDALRLLQAAADASAFFGDRAGAARDLAAMSVFITRAPGIMATPPTVEEAVALLDAARAVSDGSLRAEAAILSAAAFAATGSRPPAPGTRAPDPSLLDLAERAVAVAHAASDPVVQSVALDQLCAVHEACDDLATAQRIVARRTQLVHTLPVDATTGFEWADCLVMASDVALGVGDLAGAIEYADAHGRLPFYRGEDHLATARRLKVDALIGNLDAVVADGERFRVGWERAGRPVATNLGPSAHAVAMVHGMSGDRLERDAWLGITIGLGLTPERLAGCETGWAPTFDALLELHRGDPAAALRRLAVDLDDADVWGRWNTGLWRPWYAAFWAEAAVLVRDPSAPQRIHQSRAATRDNPVTAAIVERASSLAGGDASAVRRLEATFTALGCPYQQMRTRALATAKR